ncbi:hypothetical protein TNCV_2616301 [Trichonephila clavipes]|nr:hypothetical protein TNCV_2616301 [Trichonephila clavipes]
METNDDMGSKIPDRDPSVTKSNSRNDTKLGIQINNDMENRIPDEALFWLNGYVNKQNCRIWSEAIPQVYVEIPLHPEKLTVWCALWASGILL